MKLLVLSDTHGKSHRVDEVIRRNPDYDALIFLGDGLRDFDKSTTAGLVCVKGNCDEFLYFEDGGEVPAERMLTLDGYRLLMMHGHTKNVKSGIERAVAYAYDKGADVLLYGHTHICDEKYYPVGSELCGRIIDRPMYAFNPGSLGQPGWEAPTFGVIQIKGGQILFSHGRLK